MNETLRRLLFLPDQASTFAQTANRTIAPRAIYHNNRSQGAPLAVQTALERTSAAIDKGGWRPVGGPGSQCKNQDRNESHDRQFSHPAPLRICNR